MSAKLIDETGNRYGLLTVSYLTKDKNGRTAWFCNCACGNSKIVRGSDLRKNKVIACSKSCPAKKEAGLTGAINEIGNKYGRLTVKMRAPYNSKSNQILWLCDCECGTKNYPVLGESLRNGLTKSCRCLANELSSDRFSLDITNKRYGKLIAKEKVGSGADGIIWRCECDCGNNNFTTTVHSLQSGNTKSCGCLKHSFGEYKIQEYLNKMGYYNNSEYTFKDLLSENNKPFRYDFALLNNNNNVLGLIEFNGEQHYHPVEYYGGEEGYKKRIKYDNIKKEYAINHNIPLLIIKYTDENKIEEIIDNFVKEIKYGFF